MISSLLLISAAAMNSMPYVAWDCTALDRNQNTKVFTITTNGAGEPINFESSDLYSGAARPRSLERLKNPHVVRLRLNGPDGDRLLELSKPEFDPRVRVVSIDQDLGDSWPYTRMELRGLCRATARAADNTTVAELSTGWRFWGLNVRLVDARKRPVDASWRSDCSIVMDNGIVVRLPMTLTMSDRKMRAAIGVEPSHDWPFGPVNLAGISFQSFRMEMKGARRVLTITSHMEGKGPLERLYLLHFMADTGSGVGQTFVLYAGKGKATRYAGAGMCHPIGADEIAPGLQI